MHKIDVSLQHYIAFFVPLKQPKHLSFLHLKPGLPHIMKHKKQFLRQSFNLAKILLLLT